MEELFVLFWLVCWLVQVVVDRRHIYMLLQKSSDNGGSTLERKKKGEIALVEGETSDFLNVCINMEQPSYDG